MNERDRVIAELQALYVEPIPPHVHDPAVRSTDPDTSWAAAVPYRTETPGQFIPGTKAARMLGLYAAARLTDQEAAIVLSADHGVPDFEGYRRRGSQLRAAGYISDTGVRRKNPNSNRQGMVCALTEAGRVALYRLQATGRSS